jgi:hypothetical protein
MTPFRYLLIILSLFIIAIGGYVGVVYVVDPYGFYRADEPRGLFPIKPAMTKNQNMAKSNIIREIGHDTVIIGSSRDDYGLSPDHPAFENTTVYNAGIKGIRMAETKDMIIHAVENGATHIVWAVDFFTFNVNIEPRPDFDESRLTTMDSNGAQSDWDTLISISSLKPTLQTILYRNNKQVSSVKPNGQTTGADLNKKNSQKGMEAMFIDDLRLYLSRLYFPSPARTFKMANGTQNALRDMSEAMAYLKNKNIKTTIMVPPVHAQLLTLMYQTGLYPYYKMWKTALYMNANANGLTVYDFTAVNAITTEPIPHDKDQNMQYWWEASHYKPIIGYAMLSELLLEQRFVIPQFSGYEMTIPSINTFEPALIEHQCLNLDATNAIRQTVIDTGLENRLIPPLNCP